MVKKIKETLSRTGTLNIILICVGAYTVYINFQMLDVYRQCGSAPEETDTGRKRH